jgi:DNA-directed RNA polymerase subunit RPC12/RpoP
VPRNVKDTTTKKEFHCPYCDKEIQQANLPWCQACGVKITYCQKCGQPVAKDKAVCPHCGTKFSVK